MTYRELINSVLRRLRENTIGSNWSGALNDSSAVNDYQKLIGELVNEAKREVEDAWNWTVLRNNTSITTTADVQGYSLQNSNNRTRILLAQETTNGTVLQEMSDPYLQFTKYPTSSVQKTIPHYYSVTSVDTATGLLGIEFDPVPDAAYTIFFRHITPQDELTTATSILKVPTQPVILGAWARAIAERGEDGGSMSDMVFSQYQNALADAIQIDAGRTVGEVDFYAR